MRPPHPITEVAVENDWEQLSRGQTVGKRIGIGIVAGGGLGTAGLQMFEVSGDTDDAMALSILLSPPRVNSLANLGLTQSGPIPNLSSTQDNNEQNIAGGFKFADPFARVEWGMGGISNTVDVDIHNGAMLNLTASFVRIRGFIGDPPLLVASDGAYELSAFVGPGRDKGLGCQRTIMTTTIPAVGAEGPAFAVPRFARRVRMAGSAGLSLVFAGSLRFYRDRGKNSVICEYFFSGNVMEPVLIPNGAYYFSFVSQVVSENMQAIFDLAV